MHVDTNPIKRHKKKRVNYIQGIFLFSGHFPYQFSVLENVFDSGNTANRKTDNM